MSYKVAKGKVRWPADAGVLLHASYPKNEPRWEYYSDLAWKPWNDKGMQQQEGPQTAGRPNERLTCKIEGERNGKERVTYLNTEIKHDLVRCTTLLSLQPHDKPI